MGNADNILPPTRKRFSSNFFLASNESQGCEKSTNDLICSNVSSSRPIPSSSSYTETVEVAVDDIHFGDATTVPSSFHLTRAVSVVSPMDASPTILAIWSTPTSASVHAMNSPVIRS